jgi:DNA modification methylase
MTIAYKTKYWKIYQWDSLNLLSSRLWKSLEWKIDLLITSPPFPLNAKKKYWNLQWEEYYNWFVSMAPIFSKLLSKNWSIVIEIWNAWEPWRPVQSLLNLKSLLWFVENKDAWLKLIQEFIVYNPARLPSPAPWVTKQRIRTIDSFTHVWWMSKTDFPKSDNSKVLRPYSKSMKNLLKNQKYNSWIRPSWHHISETSFLKSFDWSIMHNVIELESIDDKNTLRFPENILSISNAWEDKFVKKCKELWVNPHPARMNSKLVSFFIEFLTDKWDLILDPFAWSNTTWYIAEIMDRNWIWCEMDEWYINQSKLRFQD